jgi:D-3-phosphoglycerate dehydrogenase
MNDVFPFMKEAAKRFGKDTEVFGEEFDDPSYKVATEYFATVEKNGPDGQMVPEFLDKYGDAEVVISFFSPFGTGAFDKLKGLRMIGSVRGGYQHINLEEATKRGIAVFNTPGRNAHSVSDFAIGLIFAECREICRNAEVIMSGKWLDPSFKTHYQPELFEKTIGLVGLGAIGALVAEKLARGWDMKVYGYDPYADPEKMKEIGVEMVSLEKMFAESDFISVHAKATDQNVHMIDKKLLSMMKPTAFFINTARASLVDMDALYDLLKEHKIAGAGLDVMDKEPIPADDKFLKLDNVTITGHLAGNSSDTTSNSPHLLVREMIACLSGTSKRGLVNPQVLDDAGFSDWLEKAKAAL